MCSFLKTLERGYSNMFHYYGEIAALATALFWSLNSILFTFAGKRVGSLTVNYLRIWIALIILTVIHILFYNTPFPVEPESFRLFYLGISGIIGLVIGDGCLFEAYILIGPRLSMLLMLLVPIFSVFLGWIVLDEKLLLIEITAILITVVGIGWVIFDKNKNSVNKPPNYTRGVFLGIIAAACQAVGLLFSKIGMRGGFSAISANCIRMLSAAVLVLLVNLFLGKVRERLKGLKNKKACIEICSGAFVGPVLGIIFSLIAITNTHIGVASTLMSLCPVILLPISSFLFKEKIGFTAIFGTIIALLGASLLFFS